MLHKNDGRADQEIKKEELEEKGRRVRMLEISLKKKKKDAGDLEVLSATIWWCR